MSNESKTRGIRGAITVEENSAPAINEATKILLSEIIKENNISKDDIAYAFFTMTADLNADFPAKTARIELGWDDVPMMCAVEIPVEGSIEKCIRALITINTNLDKSQIKHVYLGRARKLRPDLA